MRMHIALFLICLLGLSGVPQRVAAHQDDELPPVALMAKEHLKQGRYAQALAAAEAWAAEATADPRAFSLAMTTAVFARDKAKALAFARKGVELSPAAIGPRASLVLALQLSGKRQETRIARTELYELWQKSDAASQRPASFRRDDFDHAGKKVVAAEFFELQGQRLAKYEFFVYDASGGPIASRISFGKLKEGEQTYHLDRYYPDNSRETLGSFDSELSYDDVKAMATAVISGKHKAASVSPAR